MLCQLRLRLLEWGRRWRLLAHGALRSGPQLPQPVHERRADRGAAPPSARPPDERHAPAGTDGARDRSIRLAHASRHRYADAQMRAALITRRPIGAARGSYHRLNSDVRRKYDMNGSY